MPQTGQETNLPLTHGTLRRAIRDGSVTLTDPGGGHGPTRYPIFLNTHPRPPRFQYRIREEKSDLKAQVYEVCYETQWEPYYILPKRVWISQEWQARYPLREMMRDEEEERVRDGREWRSGQWLTLPLYDERFENQGGDKQSHALYLNALGVRFFVAREHFLLHMDHRHGMDGWPGGWREDQSDRHVVRLESRDEPCPTKKFGYFDDFLPEMEHKFGKLFRWPRGCSHALFQEQRMSVVPLLAGME
jgi:hypothetical protein